MDRLCIIEYANLGAQIYTFNLRKSKKELRNEKRLSQSVN